MPRKAATPWLAASAVCAGAGRGRARGNEPVPAHAALWFAECVCVAETIY